MPNAVLDPAVQALTAQIAALNARIAQLERNQRSAYNIQNTSIEGGALTVNDTTGAPAAIFGQQADGTYGWNAVGQAVPTLAPATPQVVAAANSLMVVWNGTMAGGANVPANFAAVQVHCSGTQGFTPSPATLAGSIASQGVFTVPNLTAGTTYYVALVGVNQQGNTGPASAQVSGVPLSTTQTIPVNSIGIAQLVTNLVYAGIVDATTITGATIIADGTSGDLFGYSGPPQLGNMFYSVSPVAGVENQGNHYDPGVVCYRGPTKARIMVDPTNNVPALHLVTGNASEQGYASVYNEPGNVGLANESETMFLQGPSNTYDGLSAAVLFESSSANGTLIANGSLCVYGSSLSGGEVIIGYWNTSGLHLEQPLYGFGGILTVGDNINMVNAGSGPFLGGESWHAISLASGLTGTFRVKLLPWNAVWLDIALTYTQTSSAQSFTIGSLPSASYYPTNWPSTNVRIYDLGTNATISAVAQAPPRLYVPTSGGLQVLVPASGATTTATLSANIMWPTN